MSLLFIFFIWVWILPTLITLFVFYKKDNIPSKITTTSLPFVSVLVAARNEEHTIISCLQSLNSLDYPLDRLEILIGNDASEDNTVRVVKNYITDKPQFRLYDITQPLGTARAKANVLAQLARKAKGEFFFITDADIQVPVTWVRTMLAACYKDTGIITGVTLITGKKLFHKLQGIDWAYALALIKVLDRLRIPVTAMGNNMMVRREAYFATGGYECMPASIIEDYQLFKYITKAGWGFRQLYNQNVAALSLPMPDLKSWLFQRHRWLQGALQLPLYMRCMSYFQVLMYPALVVYAFYAPQEALFIFLLKIIIELLILLKALQKINRKELSKYLIFYQLYSLLLYSYLIFYAALSRKIKWKGREY